MVWQPSNIFLGEIIMADTIMLTPVMQMYPDDRYENLLIELILPGIEKKDISFKLDENSFYLVANKEGVKYVASYSTCCPVDAKKAIAKYENGILKVTVPYQQSLEGLTTVKIE
jgi:HSP20 family protein